MARYVPGLLVTDAGVELSTVRPIAGVAGVEWNPEGVELYPELVKFPGAPIEVENPDVEFRLKLDPVFVGEVGGGDIEDDAKGLRGGGEVGLFSTLPPDGDIGTVPGVGGGEVTDVLDDPMDEVEEVLDPGAGCDLGRGKVGGGILFILLDFVTVVLDPVGLFALSDPTVLADPVALVDPGPGESMLSSLLFILPGRVLKIWKMTQTIRSSECFSVSTQSISQKSNACVYEKLCNDHQLFDWHTKT